MLTDAIAQATVPAEDIERAIRFYTDVLGLKKLDEQMEGVARFQAGHGTQIVMYERDRTKAEHTAITFTVDNVEEVVKGLAEKGVTMEHYDFGSWKTDERGIADMGDFKAAWLTDTEGNILGITGA